MVMFKEHQLSRIRQRNRTKAGASELYAYFTAKKIGKPDAGKLLVRFDEGGLGETCSLLYPGFFQFWESAFPKGLMRSIGMSPSGF
jgi:hypothetical protein